MNSSDEKPMVKPTRVIAAAILATFCVAGCGTSATSDSSLTPSRSDTPPTPVKSRLPVGEQTVTFHIKEMGERLELLCPD
jgi:hypothetical protein